MDLLTRAFDTSSEAQQIQGGGISKLAKTVKEGITSQIADTKRRLAELEEVETLLARNPDFERLLTLLGRRY